MAIVPGVEPIQGQSQQVEPFQPLPVEQISATSQRLTERLQNVRGSHADLMAQIAQQEVLPQNQQAYELATQGVRQRLRELAQDDRYYNKLPQVRREARRFAEVAKGFKQNREAIQETLSNLEEAENIPDEQRAIMRQRILQDAQVNLTEEGTVDPSTISQSRNIRPGQDPREFLDERLSDMEERTIHQRSSGDGIIKKSTQDVLTFDRLQRQGAKELGFKIVEGPDGKARLENIKGVNPNPEVNRWLERQKSVYRRSIANRMRREGKNPQENPEEFRNKVNQALEDEVFNMVNIVASRHVSGDVNPQVTIKSDPRVDGSEESTISSESDTGPFGGATVNPGITIADDQAKKIQEATKERYLNEKFNENENITRDEYSEIKSMMSNTGEKSFAGEVAPISGIPSKAPAERRVRNRFGEATLEAYKKIRRGEENINSSIGEFAIQQRSFDFTNKPKERNMVERTITGEDPKNLKSSQLTKEQISWLIADENRFQLMDVATDGSWFRVKPKAVEEMPGGENFIGFGREKPNAGSPIVIKNVGRGVGEGSAQQDFIGAITEGLDDRARSLIEQEQKVSGQSFGRDWSKVNSQPDVSIKLSGISSGGDFQLRKQTVEPRFVSKVGDDPVTFERVGEALIDNDVSKGKLREFASGMAQAANKISAVQRLISDPRTNMNPITTGSMSNTLIKWFTDRENMSDQNKKIVETIMKSPIPASRPGISLQWAEQLKKLQ